MFVLFAHYLEQFGGLEAVGRSITIENALLSIDLAFTVWLVMLVEESLAVVWRDTVEED